MFVDGPGVRCWMLAQLHCSWPALQASGGLWDIPNPDVSNLKPCTRRLIARTLKVWSWNVSYLRLHCMA